MRYKNRTFSVLAILLFVLIVDSPNICFRALKVDSILPLFNSLFVGLGFLNLSLSDMYLNINTDIEYLGFSAGPTLY